MKTRSAFIMIFLGASLWGVIGLFVNELYEYGFSPLQVVALRVSTAMIILFIYIGIYNFSLLKIKPADTRYFIGTGVISIVLFNWCLFSAMEATSMSIAFVLLYTAPAFVTLLSRLFFKEWLTTKKITALLTTFIGCMLVIGLLPHGAADLSIPGLLFGLGSGLFYALYSIFGKVVLKKYRSLTVTFYTFLLATISIVPFSMIWEEFNILGNLQVWLLIFGLGLLSTVLPFLLYTKGLEKVESSRAAIVATIEPVVATLIGYLFYSEVMTLYQYTGVILVLLSVVIVQETRQKRAIPKVKSSVS
ncbi:DMT family transporter [Halobacillus karajensis]|uniref:Inner membrane transporter YicL n=1 Tax=Halobacillus karajensis TaxID=195088 RepID=A0A024P139_9BACI|nr:EamA family transporter [Halobacillus karajensis]CDQ19397.1 putative inner membrane transporter YicL [Halobacillus karajensis]CDQ21860.1 putative inner membrane transporter YicL [Halobacillus karajensis]CDQ27700.1 putative inner membrane transporter YicL [Halobacillus karajensis]